MMAPGLSTNGSKSFDAKRRTFMSAAPIPEEDLCLSYLVDAVPEDEEMQEELNRRLRKPGEPPYCPPVKPAEAAYSPPGFEQAVRDAEEFVKDPMSATPPPPWPPLPSFAFDAIPEDEEMQEELNRRLRKPGEPPYCPPVKNVDSAIAPPAVAKAEPVNQARINDGT
jgi:hypothetical protein